jgi:hypothetical protein
VTPQQDQEFRAPGDARPVGDEDWETPADADAARAEPDEDDEDEDDEVDQVDQVDQVDDDDDDDDDDDEVVALDDDVIVAEVIDEEPAGSQADNDTGGPENNQPSSMPAEATATPAQMSSPVSAEASSAPAAAGAAQPYSEEQFSRQWSDIQAGFVDDPRGAVRLAAQAADEALTALVDALRERQAALGSAESTQDTELLRSALREYRQLCRGIEQVGRELPPTISGN